jgi:hypothetical protein
MTYPVHTPQESEYEPYSTKNNKNPRQRNVFRTEMFTSRIHEKQMQLIFSHHKILNIQ